MAKHLFLYFFFQNYVTVLSLTIWLSTHSYQVFKGLGFFLKDLLFYCNVNSVSSTIVKIKL